MKRFIWGQHDPLSLKDGGDGGDGEDGGDGGEEASSPGEKLLRRLAAWTAQPFEPEAGSSESGLPRRLGGLDWLGFAHLVEGGWEPL